jgi:type IV pilus assembly protein PilY1
VRDPSYLNWKLSNGTTPFFQAQDSLGNPQPITAAPTTVPNPNTVTITTSGSPLTPISVASTMVLFGTGKYLEQTDDSPPFERDSFYGIWDKHDGTTVARSALLQQQVLGATTINPYGTTAGGFRITTPYKPNYTGSPRTNAQFGVSNPAAADAIATSPAHRGRLLDLPFSGDPYTNPNPPPATLPGTGERVVFRPIISTGKLVFTTLVPTAAACQFGGTSFLMDLDPVTGSRLTVSPFAVNGDTNFTSANNVTDPYGNLVPVSGQQSTIGIVPTPTVIQMSPSAGQTPGKEVKVLSGSSGQLISVLELGGAPSLPGASGRRILWRQLFTD